MSYLFLSCTEKNILLCDLYQQKIDRISTFRYMVVGQKADKWLILKIEKMGFICIFGIKSGFFRTIGLKSNKIVRQ